MARCLWHGMPDATRRLSSVEVQVAVQRPQDGSSCVFQREAVSVVAVSGVVVRCSVSPQRSTVFQRSHTTLSQAKYIPIATLQHSIIPGVGSPAGDTGLALL